MAEALVWLQTQTASSSSELDFTSCLTSTYDDYVIEFIEIVPATSGGVSIGIQMHINGGAYDTGTNYDWNVIEAQSGALNSHGGSSDNQIYFCNAQESGTAVGFSAKVYLLNPTTTALKKYAHGTGVQSHGTGGSILGAVWIAAIWKSLSAADGFKVFASSGNLASGVVRLYGVSPLTPLVPYGGTVISDNEEGGFIEIGCPILI